MYRSLSVVLQLADALFFSFQSLISLYFVLDSFYGYVFKVTNLFLIFIYLFTGLRWVLVVACKRFLNFFNFYLWLCWVFVAVRGLSLVVSSGGYSSLWCTGFSLWWLLLLRSMGSRRGASVVVARGLSSCGSQALEHRLSSCGSRA